MASERLQRSRSDPPPPITVEDTATGAPPRPSPSPTRASFPPRTSTISDRPSLPRAPSAPASPSRPLFDHTPATNDLRSTRRTTFGHRRKHSPNLEWRERWTTDSWKQGRVLLIDYVSASHATPGRRKIAAQEFCDVDALRRFYQKEDLSAQAALRVIHVQNASWATRFLLRKFNIDASDEIVGTTFGRWARYERPQQRGGKPVLNGKTFRAQRDPWRGISRAAFGCDYLKHYPLGSVAQRSGAVKPMMELNSYDAGGTPCHGFDVYVQRLSVYVQLSDGQPGQAVDPDIPNPYNEEAYEEYQRLKKQYGNVDANEHQEKYIPKLRTLDNGNTIIIFENSVSGSVKDTLIGARQELESRWRRLTFYMPREEMASDEMMTGECMDFILKDIFKALAYNWDKFLAACETHVGILEDKIYENPADESRAPELWRNSALWLKVERLLYLHADMIKEMRGHLHDLASADPKEDEPWLGAVPDELDKLTGHWDRDVIQPTTALSDLMYKSVGIRDARHSLQLGLSMWRLSWITFIFLPLTFTVGFFGMNVNTFAENPPIKWYFIASCPILILVLVLWYGVKHSLSTQRQTPLRRGVYEALYVEFSTAYPGLWTRRGPRVGVTPVGWWAKVKWALLARWFGIDRLRVDKAYDPATEAFGVWSRCKRALARRWLHNIRVLPEGALPATSGEASALHTTTSATTAISTADAAMKEHPALTDLLAIATPVGIAEADPTAASGLVHSAPLARFRSLSPSHSRTRTSEGGSPGARPSSEGGYSGVMVEEERSEVEGEGEDNGLERELDGEGWGLINGVGRPGVNGQVGTVERGTRLSVPGSGEEIGSGR